MCNDDLRQYCARKRTRHDGGALGVACPSADDYCSQGGSLPVVGIADSCRHPAHVGYRARCTVAGLIGMDFRGITHLYPVSALVRAAHIEHRPDAVRGPARVGDGAVAAHRDALRYAVSCGVDAYRAAMDFGHHPAPLLHPGHAQTDDYGRGHSGSMARGGSPYRHDRPVACCFT